jgi:hypothetical protein
LPVGLLIKNYFIINIMGTWIKILDVRRTVPTWDIEIQITEPNQIFGVDIASGTNPDITVDWGDGTVENFRSTGFKEHSYTFAGEYIVKIFGSFSSNGNINFNLTPFIIKSTSVIPTIPGLSRFENTFAGCSNLISLPSGLFSKNQNVTNFEFCFENCSSLQFIPPLFGDNFSAVNFRGCFAGCSSLHSISANLFTNSTAATNFIQCFAACMNLQSVPSTIFETNIAATNFFDCFFNTPLTTQSYSDLLINLASNANLRPNNVPFGLVGVELPLGARTKYNSDGQVAKQILQNKSWTFNDGGLE